MTDDLKERLRPPGRSVVSKCDDVDGADLSNVPLTYERIWLQSDGGDGVTWCQHPQDDEDVPYVRADFYAASLARITDLEARLAAAEAGEWKARAEKAEAERDAALAQVATAITGNKSGTICRDCRGVGMIHCSDPFNCGGMQPYTVEELKSALSRRDAQMRAEGYRIAAAEAVKLGAHIVAPEHCPALAAAEKEASP